jgi:hypothetical protein
VFEKELVRRILGPVREEVIGRSSKLCNEEFNRKMAVFWFAAPCLVEVYQHFRDTCCLSMLVDFYQSTWHYNPEDCHLHTHRHEKLKSYKNFTVC